MLVYCSTFDLRLDAEVNDVNEIIAAWISRKARLSFSAERLNRSDSYRLNSVTVTVTNSVNSSLWSSAVRVTHGDAIVHGRQWVTEIGLWQTTPDSNLKCSVLLETNDVSTRVTEAVEPSRPLLVHHIVERFGHPALCPGTRGVMTLTSENASDFKHFLEDPGRKQPIVLLSARNADNEYYANPKDVCFQAIGLADVYMIPPGEDTWRIGEILGRRNTSWNGALNILFPAISRHDTLTIPNYLLLPEELESLLMDDRRIPAEVLARVTHHTNLPNLRRHLSPEKVHQGNLLYRVEKARLELQDTGGIEERIKLLEELLEFQSEENKSIQAQNENLQLDLAAQDDALRELKFEMETMRSNLVQVQLASSSQPTFSDEELKLLRLGIGESLTPEACLRIIEILFPERVLVLDSAIESAHRSNEFRYSQRLFLLLWDLVTCYRDAFLAGNGDAGARTCFGKDSYAAQESETVNNTEMARKRRTFILPDGNSIYMAKHLKIGVKESVADTIRVHFDWIAEFQKIVIGHCGPHLNFG